MYPLISEYIEAIKSAEVESQLADEAIARLVFCWEKGLSVAKSSKKAKEWWSKLSVEYRY